MVLMYVIIVLNILNNIIGYVPQKATLFSGDILSNVSFGKNIDGKPSNKKNC